MHTVLHTHSWVHIGPCLCTLHHVSIPLLPHYFSVPPSSLALLLHILPSGLQVWFTRWVLPGTFHCHLGWTCLGSFNLLCSHAFYYYFRLSAFISVHFFSLCCTPQHLSPLWHGYILHSTPAILFHLLQHLLPLGLCLLLITHTPTLTQFYTAWILPAFCALVSFCHAQTLPAASCILHGFAWGYTYSHLWLHGFHTGLGSHTPIVTLHIFIFYLPPSPWFSHLL